MLIGKTIAFVIAIIYSAAFRTGMWLQDYLVQLFHFTDEETEVQQA